MKAFAEERYESMIGVDTKAEADNWKYTDQSI
jgi:hypothetical protein